MPCNKPCFLHVLLYGFYHRDHSYTVYKMKLNIKPNKKHDQNEIVSYTSVPTDSLIVLLLDTITRLQALLLMSVKGSKTHQLKFYVIVQEELHPCCIKPKWTYHHCRCILYSNDYLCPYSMFCLHRSSFNIPIQS